MPLFTDPPQQTSQYIYRHASMLSELVAAADAVV